MSYAKRIPKTWINSREAAELYGVTRARAQVLMRPLPWKRIGHETCVRRGVLAHRRAIGLASPPGKGCGISQKYQRSDDPTFGAFPVYNPIIAEMPFMLTAEPTYTYRSGIQVTAEDVIRARDHYAAVERRWRNQQGKP